MNPLGNGNRGFNTTDIQQGIRQVKQMMRTFSGNANQILQQNPALNQVMQMYKGQDPQQIFTNMCRQRGVDPAAIIKELQS